jgi:hypothetical protein
VALIFVVLATFALLTPAQSDTFWHLRSGQQMWATGRFLTREPFSYTAAGLPLHNHWWLSQLAFYMAYRMVGPFGLTVFAGICALLATVGSYRLMRGAVEVRIALLAYLAVITAPEWAIRPQVVSLAFLVLVAHLIERNRVAWLPVVCVVWANSHAMVIFGVVMAGACALEAALWTRRLLIRDALVAGLCIAAPCFSPLGLSYWPQVLATVSTSRELQIDEYRMPLGANTFPFWIAMVALVWLAIRRWRTLPEHPRADRILLLSAAILGIAAVTAERNVAFFSVIAAPVLSRLFVITERRRSRAGAGTVGYALVAGFALAATIYVAVKWRQGGTGWKPISDNAIAAVRACPDPMFNLFKDGGYLMWAIPGKKVFIDNRIEAYPAGLFRRSRAADLFGDYQDLFRDYAIACAIVETGSPLDANLRAANARIAYADASRTVFLTY